MGGGGVGRVLHGGTQGDTHPTGWARHYVHHDNLVQVGRPVSCHLWIVGCSQLYTRSSRDSRYHSLLTSLCLCLAVCACGNVCVHVCTTHLSSISPTHPPL